MTPRKLQFKSERLVELTTDELHRLAGAAMDGPITRDCLSLVGACPSWQACTTAPSCGCETSWNCQ